METVLMVVTLVSLVLAVGMSVVAWRLLRDDRQRSGARSDALREMAAALDVDDEPEPENPPRASSACRRATQDGSSGAATRAGIRRDALHERGE